MVKIINIDHYDEECGEIKWTFDGSDEIFSDYHLDHNWDIIVQLTDEQRGDLGDDIAGLQQAIHEHMIDADLYPEDEDPDDECPPRE